MRIDLDHPTPRIGLHGILVLAFVLAAAAPAAANTFVGSSGPFSYFKDREPIGPMQDSYVAAQCLYGTEVIGGGATISGDPEDAFLTDLFEVDHSATYGVGARHDGSASRTATSWATCIYDAGRQRSDGITTSEFRTEGPNELSVNCGDRHAVGGGVGGRGEGDARWSIHSSFPIDGPDRDNTPDDGWKGRALLEHSIGSEGFAVEALCLGGRSPTYKSATARGDGPRVTAAARCPRDTAIISGGADVSGGSDESHLTTTAPFDGNDSGQVPDGWKVTAVTDAPGIELAATAIAICR